MSEREPNNDFPQYQRAILKDALSPGDTLVVLDTYHDRLIAAHISDRGWVDLFIADGQIKDKHSLRHIGLTPSQFQRLMTTYERHGGAGK